MAVPVGAVIDRKGSDVATIPPGASLSEAVAGLSARNIGALVVSEDGRAVEGILSERDIVRCLAEYGEAALSKPVHVAMTTEVSTCSRETTVDELMGMMTNQRIRHVPVIVDGALGGIVSIGDVVKSRLEELEVHAESLERYVTGSLG